MALAIWERALEDLVTLVQGLSLLGTPGTDGDIVPARVFSQTLPEQLALSNQWPCVLVTTFGEQEEEQAEGESFEEDSVTYPVRILILDQLQTNYQARRQDYMSWRHTIQHMLRGLNRKAYPILPNTKECFRVRVRDMPNLDPRLPESQLVQAGLTALVDTEEQTNG